MASHHSDNWCTLLTFQGQEVWIQVVSLNDIHNKKLHNAFLSGSAILNAALLYMNFSKNVHPQSKFRPIALQHKSNQSTFVLFNPAGIVIFFTFFGILATFFYKFHWTSKVYATLIMGNRILGVQTSIKWILFAVKTVILLWQTAKARDIASDCHFRHAQSFATATYFRITKGPQLISETNIPLLIPEWWRLCILT